jgi:hypothetical protein
MAATSPNKTGCGWRIEDIAVRLVRREPAIALHRAEQSLMAH